MTQSKYKNIRFWISISGTIVILGLLWILFPDIMKEHPSLFSSVMVFANMGLGFLFDIYMKKKYPDMIVRIFPNDHDERALILKGKAAYKFLQLIYVFGISYFFVLGITNPREELFNFLAISLIGGIIVYSLILQYYKKSE